MCYRVMARNRSIDGFVPVRYKYFVLDRFFLAMAGFEVTLYGRF